MIQNINGTLSMGVEDFLADAAQENSKKPKVPGECKVCKAEVKLRVDNLEPIFPQDLKIHYQDTYLCTCLDCGCTNAYGAEKVPFLRKLGEKND